jgi:hypothetical protein
VALSTAVRISSLPATISSDEVRIAPGAMPMTRHLVDGEIAALRV